MKCNLGVWYQLHQQKKYLHLMHGHCILTLASCFLHPVHLVHPDVGGGCLMRLVRPEFGCNTRLHQGCLELHLVRPKLCSNARLHPVHPELASNTRLHPVHPELASNTRLRPVHPDLQLVHPALGSNM